MVIPATMLKGTEDYHPGLRDLEKMSLHLTGLIQKRPVLEERDGPMKSRSLGCITSLPLPAGEPGEAARPPP